MYNLKNNEEKIAFINEMFDYLEDYIKTIKLRKKNL